MNQETLGLRRGADGTSALPASTIDLTCPSFAPEFGCTQAGILHELGLECRWFSPEIFKDLIKSTRQSVVDSLSTGAVMKNLANVFAALTLILSFAFAAAQTPKDTRREK